MRLDSLLSLLHEEPSAADVASAEQFQLPESFANGYSGRHLPGLLPHHLPQKAGASLLDQQDGGAAANSVHTGRMPKKDTSFAQETMLHLKQEAAGPRSAAEAIFDASFNVFLHPEWSAGSKVAKGVVDYPSSGANDHPNGSNTAFLRKSHQQYGDPKSLKQLRAGMKRLYGPDVMNLGRKAAPSDADGMTITL